MRQLLKSLVVALLCFGSLTAFGQHSGPVRIGLLPAEDAAEMVRQFQGMADHIAKTTSRPVNVVVSQSYTALLESLRAGHLDIIYAGGEQFVQSKRLGITLVPLAVARTPRFEGDTKGRVHYNGCVITRADSGVKSVADLKGKTFSFVSPTSTSGGIAPRYVLLKNKIAPKTDLKNIVYAGQHDTSFLAVKNGKVDAGAVADTYFDRWKKRGILEYSEYDEAKTRLVGSDIVVLGCQQVPGTTFFARKELGPEMIEKVKSALLSLPKDAVDRYRIWGATLGFEAISTSAFDEFVDMDRVVRADAG